MNELKCQDIANELATAVRKRYVELVAFTGIFMAYESNAGRSKVSSLHENDTFRQMTQADSQPYQDALNAANKVVWKILWDAYKAGCISNAPGKVPQASYDPNKKCDNRCRNARGWDCQCSCFGAYHGANVRI